MYWMYLVLCRTSRQLMNLHNILRQKLIAIKVMFFLLMFGFSEQNWWYCCIVRRTPSFQFLIFVKHEYLRSRAYICLSLSSPFSSPSVIVSQIWPLSRYSCCYLGSLHPRNLVLNQNVRKIMCKLGGGVD